MAEMELSVLTRQCIGRRFDNATRMDEEINAWEQDRNHLRCGAQWRFKTADARIKLRNLYPTPDI